MPASFKLWVDQIVTPLTKSTRPLDRKRATFTIAAGAVYSPGSAEAYNKLFGSLAPTLFGFLGLMDMRLVIADGTRELHNGKLDREAFLAPHIQAVCSLFGQEEIPRELART